MAYRQDRGQTSAQAVNDADVRVVLDRPCLRVGVLQRVSHISPDVRWIAVVVCIECE